MNLSRLMRPCRDCSTGGCDECNGTGYRLAEDLGTEDQLTLIALTRIVRLIVMGDPWTAKTPVYTDDLAEPPVRKPRQGG